jgi:IS6 family transposase
MRPLVHYQPIKPSGLVAMMAERAIVVSHTTIHRWVVRYVPEFEQRWSRFARPVNTSWRVDEAYINIRGKWGYLTLDGHLQSHVALRLLRREDPKWKYVEVRSNAYLNNLVKQDHRAIKRRCPRCKEASGPWGEQPLPWPVFHRGSLA